MLMQPKSFVEPVTFHCRGFGKRLSVHDCMASFVDAGNAFNEVSEGLRVGVGLGLRWRSPIGPVRLDLGHGLDDPQRGWQLHLGIGPER